MSAIFCDKKDYENKSPFGDQKNKAKSKPSQIKANFKRRNSLVVRKIAPYRLQACISAIREGIPL